MQNAMTNKIQKQLEKRYTSFAFDRANKLINVFRGHAASAMPFAWLNFVDFRGLNYNETLINGVTIIRGQLNGDNEARID